MKYIGIFLIILSSAAFGIYLYIKNISVLKSIERTEKLLGVILLCLKNEHMTIEEIFSFAEKNTDHETKKFLESIEIKSLGNAVKTAEECGFCRCRDVFDALGRTFSVLGKYSVEDQTSEIEFCRKKLLSEYEKNKSEIKMRAKLAAYSGLFGGILAVILLI